VNYYLLQDNYSKKLKKIWLARSENPLLLQNGKYLTMGIDEYAHIEYMWPGRTHLKWTIGKFKSAFVIYHSSSVEELLHELKHISENPQKWIFFSDKVAYPQVENFITSTL
jgi:hypothetical protein